MTIIEFRGPCKRCLSKVSVKQEKVCSFSFQTQLAEKLLLSHLLKSSSEIVVELQFSTSALHPPHAEDHAGDLSVRCLGQY